MTDVPPGPTATDPHRWVTTTHDWRHGLDLAHLQQVRDHAAEFTAGGLQHLVLEVLAYADEEARSQQRRGRAVVTRRADGSVSVTDDGRGTDTRRDASGTVVRKPVMATRDVRFFDAVDAPLLPDDLPRRGMSTVSALSTWLEHTNHRTEGSWTQRYLHGRPESDLAQLPSSETTGTSVTFLADTSLVRRLDLDQDVLSDFAWLDVEVVLT